MKPFQISVYATAISAAKKF